MHSLIDAFVQHPESKSGKLETRSQMRVGEDVFTSGDTGPWGTVWAVLCARHVASYINTICRLETLLEQCARWNRRCAHCGSSAWSEQRIYSGQGTLDLYILKA